MSVNTQVAYPTLAEFIRLYNANKDQYVNSNFDIVLHQNLIVDSVIIVSDRNTGRTVRNFGSTNGLAVFTDAQEGVAGKVLKKGKAAAKVKLRLKENELNQPIASINHDLSSLEVNIDPLLAHYDDILPKDVCVTSAYVTVFMNDKYDPLMKHPLLVYTYDNEIKPQQPVASIVNVVAKKLESFLAGLKRPDLRLV